MADSEQLRIRGKLLKDLRVKDLKEELENRGLPKTGSKNQLLARLKSQLLLERLQSQPVKDQLPDLNEGADTDNEFVKQYLSQRQKLFEAQKEARRKLEEEESVGKPSGQGDGILPSESESQEDDSQTEPESPVKELSPPKPSKRSSTRLQKEPEAAPRRSARRTTSQSSVNEEEENSAKKKVLEGVQEVPGDDVYDQKTPEPEDEEAPRQQRVAGELSEQKPSAVLQEKQDQQESPVHEEPNKEPSPVKEKELSPVKEKEPAPVKDKEPAPLKEKEPAPLKEKAPASVKEKEASPVTETEETKSSPVRDEQVAVPHKEGRVKGDERVSSDEKAESAEKDTPDASEDVAPAGQKPVEAEEATHRHRKRDSSEKEPSSKRSRRHRQPADKSAAEVAVDAKVEPEVTGDSAMKTETDKSSTQAKEARQVVAPPPALDIATTDQDEQLDYDEDIPQEPHEPKKTEEAEPAVSSPPRKEPTIKARKISLAKGRASKDERSSKDDSKEEGRKKRRWGGSSKPKKEKALSISTDSLKEVMPALKTSIGSELNMNGTDDISEDVQATSPDIVEVAPQSPKAKTPKKAESGVPEDVTDVKTAADADVKPSAAVSPTVVTKARTSIRHAQDEVVLSTDEELSDGEVTMLKKVARPMQKTITLPVEEPVRVREKVSPPRNSLNATIHIQFLTRPFTIGQLKELLSKHGELCPDEGSFWIDKIKSHCYATFKEASSAEAARKELHGSRWPSSNPKVLCVEYGSMDEIAFRKDRYEAQLQGIPLESQKRKEESEAARIKARQEQIEARKLQREKEDAERLEARKAREEKRKKLERKASPPPREWDKHKLTQSQSPPRAERRPSRRESGRDDSRERRRERSRSRRKDERPARRDTAPEIEEKPVVSLDDLFRKTVAEPAIYWLPLTDEKIALNEKKAQERAAERKAVLEKREEEMREQQARADERRRVMAAKMKMQRERERRRPARSRSPRRRPRQISRSPVRRRRRSHSSSDSSSSRSRSRKRRASSARSTPSPRRPVRGSPSPKRPVRGSPSPKRPARRSPSPKRPARSRSRSSSRASSRSRSRSSKKTAGKESKGRKASNSPPRRKKARSGSSSSSSSSSSGSSSGSAASVSPASKK